MKESIKTGISFGLTSSVITTLGLLIGLVSGSASRAVVIGGVLTIAIADAFSDALGIHMSEESNSRAIRRVWESTATTFIAKLIFGLSFLIPITLLDMTMAALASAAWGLALLGILSYYIARNKRQNPVRVIGEHYLIAILVIVISYYVGSYISEAIG